MKYTLEFKLECINKYKNGEYVKTPSFTNARRHTFLIMLDTGLVYMKDLESMVSNESFMIRNGLTKRNLQ